MTEYRKLKDWNPKRGDVFENECGYVCRAVSDTHARYDIWERLYGDQPFKWFYQNFRLVSRASRTDGHMITAAPDLYKALEFITTCVEYGCVASGKEKAVLDARAALTKARPEPKREKLTLWGYFDWLDEEWGFAPRRASSSTHSLTLPLIDGKLPAGEYRNEAGDVITVEELK